MQPQEPDRKPPRGRGGAFGGIAVALAVAATKAKALFALLLGAKWLLLAPKLFFSFGSMFLSVWLYAAIFGGWKIAVVFVLMILVHELGHYLTWRNFGVPVNLPMFVPFMGAFVSSAGGTPAQNTAAAIAGPIFGIAAAATCWAYGAWTGQHFWLACAYIGFFLNLFNLIPTPPFDGGAIAGAIDARLWIAGVVVLILWIAFVGFSVFAVVILILIALNTIPRIIALVRGEIDPRGSGLTTGQRVATTVAYLGTVGIAIAGASATHLTAPR